MAAAVEAGVELDPVFVWRTDILLEAGYYIENAIRLAALEYVDLHTATYLITAGCDETMALEILL